MGTIDDLRTMTPRGRAALRAMGCVRVEDVAKLPRRIIQATPGIGPRNLNAIDDALARRNLAYVGGCDEQLALLNQRRDGLLRQLKTLEREIERCRADLVNDGGGI